VAFAECQTFRINASTARLQARSAKKLKTLRNWNISAKPHSEPVAVIKEGRRCSAGLEKLVKA